MKGNNIRTMKYIGEDFWSRPVFKCVENGKLWKDINCGDGEPSLYSCQNEFDGEPEAPIKADLIIHYENMPEKISKDEQFNYMMLGRLKSDCDNHINAFTPSCKIKHDNIKGIIQEMKKLYNSFSEDKKPEWLTYEQILNYEKLMIN